MTLTSLVRKNDSRIEKMVWVPKDEQKKAYNWTGVNRTEKK